MVSMMVIGPGMVILSLRAVCARANLASVPCTRPRSLSGAGHRRHHRLVAVVADAHLDLVGEVDAVDEFEKAVHEMLPRLFAVGDDVDAGVLLKLQRQQRRVELSGGEVAAASRHCGHSLSGSASHDGFGRLPAMVVGNMRTFLPYSSSSRVCGSTFGRVALPGGAVRQS